MNGGLTSLFPPMVYFLHWLQQKSIYILDRKQWNLTWISLNLPAWLKVNEVTTEH